jgi:hypothetical protein
MLDKLRHLLGPEEPRRKKQEKQAEPKPKDRPARSTDPTTPPPISRSDALPQSTPSPPKESEEDVHAYLDRVNRKISKLAEEFAAGVINREQFQELYDHYQREKRTIETWVEMDPESDEWRQARTEGKSVVIRRQHMARVVGYAIYQNESGMPIATIGKFDIDPELFVPMLSSYRSATTEIFGAGMRSSQIENGSWLCFVPGEVTTLMAVFSTEPAAKQLDSLEEVHKLFEQANRHFLQRASVNPDELVLPHRSFL